MGGNSFDAATFTAASADGNARAPEVLPEALTTAEGVVAGAAPDVAIPGVVAKRPAGMHPSTFEYLKPTDEQVEQMARVRAAAKAYCDVLEAELPDGADKTFIIRAHRSNAMWANVSITRFADGTPRHGN